MASTVLQRSRAGDRKGRWQELEARKQYSDRNGFLTLSSTSENQRQPQLQLVLRSLENRVTDCRRCV